MSSAKQKTYFEGQGCFDEVLKAEHAAIAERTGSTDQKVWTGISLSGGGIRSASFCLGALQALARYGVLSRIDYISTVSGGGYIGAGLQWLLSQKEDSGTTRTKFPYGVDADARLGPFGQSNLQYLRWHANYLLPGGGLDIFSALAVLTRTAFLSFLIWFPLIVLFFYGLQFASSLKWLQTFAALYLEPPLPSSILTASWVNEQTNVWPDKQGSLSAFYCLCFYAAYLGMILLCALSLAVAFISITKFPQILSWKFAIGSLLLAAIGAGVIWFAISLFQELQSRANPPPLAPHVLYKATTVDFLLAVAPLPLAFVLLMPMINLIGMLIFSEKYKNADYSLRRFFEVIGGSLLRYTIYSSIFASIPIAYKYLFVSAPVPTGVVTIISGITTALIGHIGQSKSISFGTIGQAAIAAVALIFLYCVLLVSFHASATLFNPEFVSEHYYLSLAAASIVLLSLIFGVASNSNTTGLHRFYRDRIMELFMPSSESTRLGRSTFSFVADRLSVSDSWLLRKSKKIGLFPIISCNSILINDPNTILSSRGGASFSITPLHLGGTPQGWESTSSYERKNREVSLATAVAASGAAANANSGYAGSGITRNRAVSLVMTLFNIRLGVWLRRPSSTQWSNLLKPTPFFPNLWYGPFSRGYRANNAFLEISDGGHFENLGVYELVRRRVDLILAFDGEADLSTSLPALVSLSRRIEEDFGAQLTFDTSLDELMPSQSSTAKYPNDAKFVRAPCARATIRYSEDPDRVTTLIYVKSSLISGAPFSARGYRAQHPDYPNESTANQFYSPEQFDAYRELGFSCAKEALIINHPTIAEHRCR